MRASMPPVTRALLFINIAVFAAQYSPATCWAFRALPVAHQFPGAPSFQLWQLLTYGFLHGSLTHLFFNMFALYMFGGEVERLLGRGAMSRTTSSAWWAALAQLVISNTTATHPR
jgi:membrane associated rhomboid family serine protease